MTMALNCWNPLIGIVASEGRISNRPREGGTTVILRAAVFPLKVAVRVALPGLTAVTRPLLLIWATGVLSEFQWAVIFLYTRFFVSVAVRSRCTVSPMDIVVVEDLISSLDIGGVTTLTRTEAEWPSAKAVRVVLPGATAVTLPT